MAALRLFVAFLLAIAIPIQGIAAATCMCKLRHGGGHAGAASTAHMKQAGSAERASLERSRSAGAAKTGEQPCPSCSKACCHASGPPPSAGAASEPAVLSGSAPGREVAEPSWFEPVPRKPPRA